MMLSRDHINQIVSRIVDAMHPHRVILFGSYATGKATEDSDLDLLIVMNTSVPSYRRRAAIRNLFWPPPTSMDILVFNPDEVEQYRGMPNHIITTAFDTGQVLYEG